MQNEYDFKFKRRTYLGFIWLYAAQSLQFF